MWPTAGLVMSGRRVGAKIGLGPVRNAVCGSITHAGVRTSCSKIETRGNVDRV